MFSYSWSQELNLRFYEVPPPPINLLNHHLLIWVYFAKISRSSLSGVGFCMQKVEDTKKNTDDKENSILSWLAEEDAPEIGIAVKEPLPEYVQGVGYEFKKITWPTREQVTNEFINVIIIVAIISVMVYAFDIGFDNLFSLFKGAIAK